MLFCIKNQVVFQTIITELDTLEKSYWYCKCKLLIASFHILFRAFSPKRHCSRRSIVKFCTLFNTQVLVFSSPYLTCINQVGSAPPPPQTCSTLQSRAFFWNKSTMIPDIISITPFFTVTLAFGIFNITLDSIWHVLHLLLKHHKLKKAWVATTLLNMPTRGAEQWFFFTLMLDNCSWKVKKMTHMAADSPAWPSSLKLGMNLIASTSTLRHFFPHSSHPGTSIC